MRPFVTSLLLLYLVITGSSFAHAQDASLTALPAVSPGFSVVIDGVTNPRGFT